MKFERNNLKSKKGYYRSFMIVEIIIIIALIYFKVNFFISLILIPLILIDILSNKRYLRRQKNFIKSIQFNTEEIVCNHLNNSKTKIPYQKAKFSIREVKFEKDRTEIEIKIKKALKSKLVGRIHIKNWSNIFEIKSELIKKSVVHVKYRPEGFWSKYGLLTADIIITGTAIVGASIAESTGDFNTASNLTDSFMPLNNIKETLKNDDKK